MAESQNTQQTQPATQKREDPRRYGMSNSGLSEEDMSDIFCILHPASLAAYKVVSQTAVEAPQHVLQRDDLVSADGSPIPAEEQETFRMEPGQNSVYSGLDLALRFSSITKVPWLGFIFGRNPNLCDVVITVDSIKRVSNKHFGIYVNENGIVMLHDMSTNGTMLDDFHLRAAKDGEPATRMLHSGAIIHIVSTRKDEYIKFICRIPSKEGFIDRYSEKFHDYMQRCIQAKAEARGIFEQNKTQQPHTKIIQSKGVAKVPHQPSTTFGMQWDGGEKYNVVGQLGKGAFATVYKLGTKAAGDLYAVKELEKRRFVKNGRLDQRLDNEMRIMKDLRHPSIVQYVDYHESKNHLYIIMEFVPFGDLQGYLTEYGVLLELLGREMSRQVLDALAYLHGKQITHRDIKPDNILLAETSPFKVKLTDFGLSKVVKNDETFLKTFCGTLLYCAPEVFPQYGTHAESHGSKRRRGQQLFHSYSHSVDIWSYAAVLWFALCGQPPFKGVPDQTGKAMFNQIMSTRLNIGPLQKRGISGEAIDLLMQMLDTEPSKRPTELQCLRHSWLNGGSNLPSSLDPESNQEHPNDLMDDREPDVSAGAEEKFSQLQIQSEQDGDGQEEPSPLDSGEFEALIALHPSKKFKADRLYARNQTRDRSNEGMDFMSSELDYDAQNLPAADSMVLPEQNAGRPRLFGEISESALQSSGVLDAKTQAALALQDTSGSVESMSDGESGYSHLLELSESGMFGTGSRFRGLEISPLQPAASPVPSPEGTNEPSTPKTPEAPRGLSISGVASERSNGPDEETPKAPARPQFDRRIQIPSMYWDLQEKSTQNLEYASKVSGIDFVGQAAQYMASQDGSSASAVSQNDSLAIDKPVQYPKLPSHITIDSVDLTAADTMRLTSENPITPNDLVSPISNQPGSHLASQQSNDSSQFIAPLPHLGRLTNLGSVGVKQIDLRKPWTSYGRQSYCTIQHPPNDTRCPKKAFELWFYNPESDIKAMAQVGNEWTNSPGLYTGINTFSKAGIWINNVHLIQKDDQGRVVFGLLRTGDTITVFKNPKTNEKLSFRVEIFKGQGATPREPGPEHEFKLVRSDAPISQTSH